MTDNELRAMWRNAGGQFHGPHVETGTMPEAALLLFLRGLVNAERERWDTLLSAARRIAEGNAKRADDCGMLSRALLDALRVLRA